MKQHSETAWNIASKFSHALASETRDLAGLIDEALDTKRPCVPQSAHWLGDRQEADASRHETDARGCVLYFERQSDCLAFMRWLANH